ncbi:MAG: hypothetical protein ACAH11_12720 [Sphingomonas sp.]
MNYLLGSFGGTLFALILGLAVIGVAMFAGGRPTDVPRVGTKAIVIGGLILLTVVTALAWQISRVPEGATVYDGRSD